MMKGSRDIDNCSQAFLLFDVVKCCQRKTRFARRCASHTEPLTATVSPQLSVTTESKVYLLMSLMGDFVVSFSCGDELCANMHITVMPCDAWSGLQIYNMTRLVETKLMR